MSKESYLRVHKARPWEAGESLAIRAVRMVRSGTDIYLWLCGLLSRTYFTGEAGVNSRPLQAAWPHKGDAEAAGSIMEWCSKALSSHKQQSKKLTKWLDLVSRRLFLKSHIHSYVFLSSTATGQIPYDLLGMQEQTHRGPCFRKFTV